MNVAILEKEGYKKLNKKLLYKYIGTNYGNKQFHR